MYMLTHLMFVFVAIWCRMAAFIIACNLLMRYVYIPTEHNPADDLSRGVARKVRQSNLFRKKSRRRRGKDVPRSMHATVEEIDAGFFNHYGRTLDDVLHSAFGL